MKKVLFIVYYFPPMGGSGVQRPLKFIKYLKEFGWEPVVLCPQPGVYQFFDESLRKELEEIDPVIYRVEGKTPFHLFGGNKRELSLIPNRLAKLARRFLRLFMYPDNKKGWIEPALRKASGIVEQEDIDLIFSTAPPFSNHLIGAGIKKKYSVPLVLDYRDSWLDNQFLTDLFKWQKTKMHRLEEEAVSRADAIVGLDEVTLGRIKEAHPEVKARFEVVPHGYDPEDFIRGEYNPVLDYKEGKFNLLYSGIFYESHQPDIFLEGVSRGLDNSYFTKEDLHLHFQGGIDQRIRALIQKMELDDIVSEYGYLNHKEAVTNLGKADALWVLENFDTGLRQVKTGKLFEYFGAQKPILAIVNPGVTANLVREYSPGFVADARNRHDIAETLSEMISRWKKGDMESPDAGFTEKYNRKEITKRLAKIFDEISAD